MRRLSILLSSAVYLGVAFLGEVGAEAADFAAEKKSNWHHWRGPTANGVAESGNPAVEWSEQKNVKWKVKLPGKSSATPIVWGNKVFVLTSAPSDSPAPAAAAEKKDEGARGGAKLRPGAITPGGLERFMVYCFDRATGKEIWNKVAAELVPHEGHHETNTYASGSPTTDGENLYVSFGSRGIYCYDLNGNLKWKRDLGDMSTKLGFGEGSSPAIHKDSLIVNWDHEAQSFLASLNAKTGDIRWQVDRNEKTTWSTPLVVEFAGKTQVITNGKNRVRSYDLETGKVIWECGGQAENPIPTPVVEGNHVYCMTGYRGFAVFAIPLDSTGDITDSKKITWSRTDSGPYVSSPVLYGGHLYFTKERNAILSSLDIKTGQPLINQGRLPSLTVMYSSPVAAANRIYFTDREGTTLVLKHGPQIEVLATNKLDDVIDASPAVVGKQLFLRGQSSLYCIEEQATGG